MNKIDKLIFKILQLKPRKFHENGKNTYYLIYDNITLTFWNMDRSEYYKNIGLVRINVDDTYNISPEAKLAVLNYFDENESIDYLLSKVDKDIRKNKLLNIENEN